LWAHRVTQRIEAVEPVRFNAPRALNDEPARVGAALQLFRMMKILAWRPPARWPCKRIDC
jgi:hypothetical protein